MTAGQVATLPAADSSAIGQQLGAVTAVAHRNAAEAGRMALALTGDSLPPSVQSWLNATEQHRLVAASIPGKHPPALPALTELERASVSQAVRSLSEVLQPARERDVELEQAITSMFAVMNVYTGDQAKLTAAGGGMVPLPRRFPAVRDPQGREVGRSQQGQAAERRRLHRRREAGDRDGGAERKQLLQIL